MTAEPNWQEGSCFEAWIYNPELAASFYAEQFRDQKLARACCATCPIKDECLAHAVATGEVHGIWGGEGRRGRERIHARLKGKTIKADTRRRTKKTAT